MVDMTLNDLYLPFSHNTYMYLTDRQTTDGHCSKQAIKNDYRPSAHSN